MSDEPRTLRQLAEASGVDAADIDAAEADGTLGLLLIDRLVSPGPVKYTQREVEAASGLGPDGARFWRALGFPDPDPDHRIFGDDDVEMLQTLDAALRLELLDRETALMFARVIGSSMERIAQAQVDAIQARIDADDGDADDRIAVQRAQLLLPVVPRILDYVWRRHLQAVARRRLVRDSGNGEGRAPVAVGFADLVGFTALSQQLDDRELALLVDRFETTAYDTIGSRGGRVVKMIGDEVMFEIADPVAAVEIALDLADAYRDDDSISDVRVGVAAGNVVTREGDLYGPTVNLASRIVSIAYPGTVVVSGEVRDAIADDDRFVCKSLRTRYLKHLGRVQLYAVRRAGDTTEGLAERARRRRSELRDAVADLVERRSG